MPIKGIKNVKIARLRKRIERLNNQISLDIKRAKPINESRAKWRNYFYYWCKNKLPESEKELENYKICELLHNTQKFTVS